METKKNSFVKFVKVSCIAMGLGLVVFISVQKAFAAEIKEWLWCPNVCFCPDLRMGIQLECEEHTPPPLPAVWESCSAEENGNTRDCIPTSGPACEEPE